MKYVLTQQAKDFIHSVVKTPERAQEIIEKTEVIFNSEQREARFSLGELKVDGWTRAFAQIVLQRSDCAELVEDWQLSAEEIDSIGAEEKLAA